MDALELAAALVGLLAWGAHAVVPWRLAGGGPAARRAWALAALPLLAAGVAAALALAGAEADSAADAGWGVTPLARGSAGALAVLVPALVVGDVVVALGRNRLEAAGWRLAAGVGLAALGAVAFAGELFRAGGGPATGVAAVAAAAGARVLFALAAGELAAPGRPWCALAGGLAVPAYWLALPAGLTRLLAGDGAGFTAAAAALLLVAAPWLPRRLRRPGLAAGVLLLALFLARSGDLSTHFPLSSPPPADLPAPPSG